MMDHDELLAREGRWAVRLERFLAYPMSRVWRAVTEPDELATWFPARVEIELWPGGTVSYAMDGGAMEPGGRVVELDPPRLLRFTWGHDELCFELSPEDGGTRLVLLHTFDDKPGAASFAAGWQQCLAALRPMLAGEALPEAHRAVAEHERLVARFGLDRPTVTESDGRWVLRFERQLTCPAEVAWELFMGRDQHTGEQRSAPVVGEPLTAFAAPDVVLGTVTEVDRPSVLAFDVAEGEPGDHVRLELSTGTGHGARLILTVTGSADRPAERDIAVERWGSGAVEYIAAEAAAMAST